ncbi:MAG TPA: hypothetical protein VMT24_02720 [Aggregatilineaceae bacterium]|nr:hypothetical protein [Aggregatilineaceae bacterium]
MPNHLDQPRISQLTSSYAPPFPPVLPLGFGDYLSILWRLDRSAGHDGKSLYYRACAIALLNALELRDTPLGQVMRAAVPGTNYDALSTVPFKEKELSPDAESRGAAIGQLVKMRSDVLTMGVYQEAWEIRWPGNGILDLDLRDRMHTVLFTALPSQYPVFARLLLVVDIVLQELLTGSHKPVEVDIPALILTYHFPDPRDPDVQLLYTTEHIPS